MLKIKDSVSLSELEKFGFVKRECFGLHNEIAYEYDNDKDFSTIIVCIEDYDKYFKAREIIMDGIEYACFETPAILYDLIKADLVEKVENDRN